MLRIQAICKAQGITIQELAARMGVTYQSLYESIKGNPTLKRLQELAAALGVEVVDLFAVRGDFIAFVRENGETRTFTAFDELRDYVNREQ